MLKPYVMLKLRVCFCQSLSTILLCVCLAFWAFHSLDLDLNPACLLRRFMVKMVMFYTLCTSLGLLHASAPVLIRVRGFFLRFTPRYFPCLSTWVSCDECLHWGSPPDLRIRELVSSSFFVFRSVVRCSRGLRLWSAHGSFVWTWCISIPLQQGGQTYQEYVQGLTFEPWIRMDSHSLTDPKDTDCPRCTFIL